MAFVSDRTMMNNGCCFVPGCFVDVSSGFRKYINAYSKEASSDKCDEASALFLSTYSLWQLFLVCTWHTKVPF